MNDPNEKLFEPEEIAEQLWSRIKQERRAAVYILTWEDVVNVLASEMAYCNLPPEALTDEELSDLLTIGGDVELPWEETLGILLSGSLPEFETFEAHRNSSGKAAFYTTPLVWECECQEHYIHPRSQDHCPTCKVSRSDAPDARMREVLTRLDELPTALRTYIQHEWVAYIQSDVELLTKV